jgi:hypothetical protein
VFLKAGNRSSADLYGVNQGVVAYTARFTLTGAGTATAIGGSPTVGILALANGWYFCWMTKTHTTGSASDLVQVVPGNEGATVASDYVYAWQADLQAGAFPSSPIVTVAASATRAADVLSYTVNTTAQIQAAVAGQPELVTNGTFATDTDWTKGADWTISAGTANYNNAGGAQVLSQAISLVEAKFYAVTYTVSALSSGFIYARLQGGSNINGATRTANGTYTELIAAPSAPTAIGFVAQGVFSIDNISVKEVPANSLTLYPLSLWAEWEMPVVTSASALAFQVDAGSNNERSYVYWSSGNVPTFGATAASSAQADIGIGAAMTAGPAFKMAGRIATNDAQAARGGTLGTADTSVTLPTTPTTIRIGSHVSAAQGFVYIRRAAVFNSALTDAQLQTTTS